MESPGTRREWHDGGVCVAVSACPCCCTVASPQPHGAPRPRQVLHDAVEAGSRIGAIFKEPTITPTEVQRQAMGLRKAWGSNSLARAALSFRQKPCGTSCVILGAPKTLFWISACLRG